VSSETEPPSSANTPDVLVDSAPEKKTWHAGTLVYTSSAIAVLFFWLLWGDFTISLKDRSVVPTLQVLLRTYHASAFVISLLLNFLPPLISIFLIPVLSYQSDRYRGRWGRRIPFLLIPLPLAVATMLLLGYSPAIGLSGHKITGQWGLSPDSSVLLSIGIFWTLFEVANMSCGAVFGWLINDVVPRPLMGRFFGMFRALSLIAGMIFSWYLLGTVKTHYLAVLVSFGILYGISFTAMCLRVKEGEYPPPDAPEKIHGHDAPPLAAPFLKLGSGIETYARDCFSKPYYLWFFLAFALAHIGFAPINNYSLIFANSLGQDDQWYGHYSAIQLGCSLLQAYFVGWLSDKFHPLRITMIALALYATSTLLAFFLVRNAPMFAAAHVICGTISGMWLTATAPLGALLLPRGKFATYASALGICTAVGGMTIAPLCGWLLDYLNPGRTIEHYDFHYIYLWASCFITASLLICFIVYEKFKSYGGAQNYIAPE